jgi:dTMP kinase
MFITFEGIEGSGKTTQIMRLYDFLKKSGRDCVVTREPGGTTIGKKIRAILLDPQSAAMDPFTELLLYTADRAQHAREILIPLLSAGKTVLCDRYFDATVAYQGYARGLDIKLINRLHQTMVQGLKPDVTILLDLGPEEGLARAWCQLNSGTRVESERRFEEETLAFHQRVRAGYLALARKEPQRFRVIDAGRNETLVQEEIITSLPL